MEICPNSLVGQKIWVAQKFFGLPYHQSPPLLGQYSYVKACPMDILLPLHGQVLVYFSYLVERQRYLPGRKIYSSRTIILCILIFSQCFASFVMQGIDINYQKWGVCINPTKQNNKDNIQITNVCVQNLNVKRWLVDYIYSWRSLHFRYWQKSKWRKGGKKFFKRLPLIYQVIWSLSCNWSLNSVMQWCIYSTTMMWCACRSSHRIWQRLCFSTLCCCWFDWKERATDCVGCLPFEMYHRRPNCWDQKYGYSGSFWSGYIGRRVACCQISANLRFSWDSSGEWKDDSSSVKEHLQHLQ